MAAEMRPHKRGAVFGSAWSCSRVEAAEGLHPGRSMRDKSPSTYCTVLKTSKAVDFGAVSPNDRLPTLGDAATRTATRSDSAV